jgi:hypothetical protein
MSASQERAASRRLEKLTRDPRKEERCISREMELAGDALFTCKVAIFQWK